MDVYKLYRWFLDATWLITSLIDDEITLCYR